MICERCHGHGTRPNPELVVVRTAYGARIENPHGQPIWIPCEDCGGSGRTHCCEGEQAQPER
jgi:hypothetical protein